MILPLFQTAIQKKNTRKNARNPTAPNVASADASSAKTQKMLKRRNCMGCSLADGVAVWGEIPASRWLAAISNDFVGRIQAVL